jgi:hypothetical protein
LRNNRRNGSITINNFKMKEVVDLFYLKKVRRDYADEPYLQCIYHNGVDTKVVAVRYGEDIRTIIYETRR